MTPEEREAERARVEDQARLTEMIYAYLKLDDWQKVKINARMTWMILTSPSDLRTRDDLAIIWGFVRYGVFPFFAPYIPVAGLFLAAAVAWAWAMTVGNEFVFVASVALGVAAFIKAAPLVLPSDSDEVE